MQAKFLETQVKEQAHGLLAFACSPVVGPERESDLSAIVLAQGNSGCSDQLSCLNIGDCKHVLAALRSRSRFHCDLNYMVDLLWRPGLKAQVPGRVSIAIYLVQSLSIVGGEFA